MLNLKNNNQNLGFSFMYLVSVDPMEETVGMKTKNKENLQNREACEMRR